jgi:hypothetical protein
MSSNDDLNGLHLHYWASYRSHSRHGEQLASTLATRLSRSQQLPPVEVTGMALPILRETSMTTLHIEHGQLSQAALGELSTDVIGRIFGRSFPQVGSKRYKFSPFGGAENPLFSRFSEKPTTSSTTWG